jgi:hypothetical protein
VLGISVRSNAQEVIAEIDGITGGGQRKAIARALNSAGDTARIEASRAIRAAYKLKVATINGAFSFQRASTDNLAVTVQVRGYPLSLAGFSARQTKRGVTVDIKGTRKLIPGAFIQRLKTNKGDEYEVVFIRQGRARYPIKALKTVDVPGLFAKDDVQVVVDDAAYREFAVELQRQIALMLKLKNG